MLISGAKRRFFPKSDTEKVQGIKASRDSKLAVFLTHAVRNASFGLISKFNFLVKKKISKLNYANRVEESADRFKLIY